MFINISKKYHSIKIIKHEVKTITAKQNKETQIDKLVEHFK